VFPVTHRPCQGVAFYLKRRVYPGDVANPDDVVLVDGSAPIRGDIIRCGACGRSSVGQFLIDFILPEFPGDA
jgi:hypothetical protein